MSEWAARRFWTDVTVEDMRVQYTFARDIWQKVNEANNAVISIRKVKTQLKERLAQSDDRRLARAASSLDDRASAVEANIYQVRNRSNQDPLNFPIKVNNRLANLLSMVERGDGRPNQGMRDVFQIMVTELTGYTTELQQIWQSWEHTFITGARFQIGTFDTGIDQSGSTGTALANDTGLSEDAFPGYTDGGVTCFDEGAEEVVPHPVTLTEGQVVTCTIANDDIAPELTVIKHVINDDGGDAVAGEWTMVVTATNPSDDSFPGAEAPGRPRRREEAALTTRNRLCGVPDTRRVVSAASSTVKCRTDSRHVAQIHARSCYRSAARTSSAVGLTIATSPTRTVGTVSLPRATERT